MKAEAAVVEDAKVNWAGFGVWVQNCDLRGVSAATAAERPNPSHTLQMHLDTKCSCK